MTTGTEPSTRPGNRSDALTVMQRIFNEGFATGDVSVVDELCSPNLVEHQFDWPAAASTRSNRSSLRSAESTRPCPTCHSPSRTPSSKTTVWVRVRARGTASGPYFGPPAAVPSTSP